MGMKRVKKQIDKAPSRLKNSILGMLILGGGLLNPTFAEEQIGTIAQKAILSNPEVLQKWHAYQATANEREVAAGGYLPRLDVVAGSARETRDDPFMTRNYNRSSATITLSQMLYDGFATRNEVRRLDHARKVRYFELLEISENIALEATRAYLDVLRYRKLVELAEENYVRHQGLFEQVQIKANAGVARRVDFEQASGRLALASANLLTETSNLHDVSARYQRIVGELPAKNLPMPTAGFEGGLPKKAAALLEVVQQENPTIQAAVENVRSAEAAKDIRKAAYQPRFDLRLRNDLGNDLNGYTGRTDNRTAEVVMSWNLFNGFSDMARSRQYADQYSVAKDIRDKTCRDIRQTAAIAYNDAQKLSDQLVYLEQHRNSTGKARDAYRKQFDIGQRTLLDLLDTENEYFQSRRAYVSAEHDLMIARLRTQASLGSLLKTLGLTRMAKDELPDLEQWRVGEEAAEQCPADSPDVYIIDKERLNAQAAALMRESRPVVDPAQVMPAPAPVVEKMPPVGLPHVPQAKTAEEKEVLGRLRLWEQAWSERDVITYIRMYSQSFIQERKGNWVEDRKRVLKSSGKITLSLSDLKFKTLNKETVLTSFKQAYQSPTYQDEVYKTLEWRLFDTKWLIVKETTSRQP